MRADGVPGGVRRELRQSHTWLSLEAPMPGQMCGCVASV